MSQIMNEDWSEEVKARMALIIEAAQKDLVDAESSSRKV
jgi:hypothetical protein